MDVKCRLDVADLSPLRSIQLSIRVQSLLVTTFRITVRCNHQAPLFINLTSHVTSHHNTYSLTTIYTQTEPSNVYSTLRPQHVRLPAYTRIPVPASLPGCRIAGSGTCVSTREENESDCVAGRGVYVVQAGRQGTGEG